MKRFKWYNGAVNQSNTEGNDGLIEIQGGNSSRYHGHKAVWVKKDTATRDGIVNDSDLSTRIHESNIVSARGPVVNGQKKRYIIAHHKHVQ